MCGIAGIMRIAPIVSPEVAIPERWLDALDRSIAARGPDGAGRWRTRMPGTGASVTHLALVHRRMAIIDPAGGAQPMVLAPRGTADGAVAIAFNGCIYNHRALREELRAFGHEFATDHSDTEVLLHGHRQWGRSLQDHLEGMYAAALWDESERSLVLMRDMVGEKPLYFAAIGTRHAPGDHAPDEPTAGDAPETLVVFASSAAGVCTVLRLMAREGADAGWASDLVAGLERATRIERGSMLRWLAFGWDEGTPWEGIRELKPGQIAWFDAESRTGRRRVSIEVESRRSLPLNAAVARSLLERSVEQRLEADVPLGCFLSGGIDSGLIAAAAQRLLAARGERLRTFTMRMPDAAYDESELAAMTAARIGSDHTVLDVAPDPASDLESLIQWLGLPLGDSSLLPTHWLSRAVRREVKVALSGDGGDELFAGYERHVAARWLRDAGFSWRLLGHLPWSERDPKSVSARLARLCAAARGAGYADLVAIFPTRLRQQLVRTDDHAICEVPREPQRVDLETYLPGDLLRKVDTASMRVALEVRAPMMDRELVWRAAATPARALLKGGRKGMLRAAARGVLSREVVDGRKSGFAIPVGKWLRQPGAMRDLMHASLGAPDAFGGLFDGEGFRPEAVACLIQDHAAGRHDHGQRLYALMAMAIWNRWRTGL